MRLWRKAALQLERELAEDLREYTPAEEALWREARGPYWRTVLALGAGGGVTVGIAVVVLRLLRGMAIDFVFAAAVIPSFAMVGALFATIPGLTWLRDKRRDLTRGKRLLDAMRSDDGGPLGEPGYVTLPSFEEVLVRAAVEAEERERARDRFV